MVKPKVLVVDDEPETVKYVSANLRVRGYDVLTAGDGRAALKVFDESVVDLVILDIMMPGPDGFAVCQAIRRRSDVPIIMLSARGREKDIVRALDLGADDYLTKPFGVEEMLARVRAVLRRAAQLPTAPRPPLTVGDLTVDFAARQVTMGNRPVQLTPTEYDLLACLALNAGRVLTHRTLLQTVWGPGYGDETEYLWAYIRRLRRKIEPDPRKPCYILTHPGVGYSFAALSAT
ncbi:MAG TPA: response regulator transcription factor [Anaerolineae bacterium]|nr:response regulator transcription factor [Anaerolineae bacterium]